MTIHTSLQSEMGSIFPKDRSSSAIRKKMSGVALRAFFQIAKEWKLTKKQEEGLLGWHSRQTLYNWERHSSTTLPYDTLTRISLVLGIYKALHILYPEKNFADQWIHLNNTNPLFGGKAPLHFMIEGGIDSLYSARRLLDSRRGGWN